MGDTVIKASKALEREWFDRIIKQQEQELMNRDYNPLAQIGPVITPTPQALEQLQTTLDKQVGGNHYRALAIQPWEIIDALSLDFYDGNALKYLLRWRDKGGVQDLKKAIHYIEHQIEKQEKKNVG
jgi:hypothetical protein